MTLWDLQDSFDQEARRARLVAMVREVRRADRGLAPAVLLLIAAALGLVLVAEGFARGLLA